MATGKTGIAIGIGLGVGFAQGEPLDTGGIDFEFLDGNKFKFLDGIQFEFLEQV